MILWPLQRCCSDARLGRLGLATEKLHLPVESDACAAAMLDENFGGKLTVARLRWILPIVAECVFAHRVRCRPPSLKLRRAAFAIKIWLASRSAGGAKVGAGEGIRTL